jgi:ATP-binding cassette subfamily B protein
MKTQNIDQSKDGAKQATLNKTKQKTQDKPQGKKLLSEFKTLRPYFSRYTKKYAAGFLCLFIVDAAQLIIPQLTKQAINLIVSGDFIWKKVLFLCLCMVGTMAIISSGRFLWRLFIHGSSRRIESELRQNLFDHLLSLSWDFYQKNKIGDLIARSTNDIGAVRMAIGWGFVAGIDGSVMAIAIIIIILTQAHAVAIFAILPLPFITILIIFFGKAVGKRFKRSQETYSALSDTVQETFAGIRVIKSFVKEPWFLKRFAENNDDYREASMSVVKIHGFFMPMITFLSGFTSLIVILAGGIRVVSGLMSPGELVALFSYVQMLIWPMLGAGFTVNIVQRGAVSLTRINEALKTEPSIQSPPQTERGAPGEGEEAPQAATELSEREAAAVVDASPLPQPIIQIKNLSFAYAGKQILRDISIDIPEGAWLGILGRTGSGKTTLIKTLPRLIDPPAGTVFVKGIDVRCWNLNELRALFGISPQDSFMFSDSIQNNILYGYGNNTNNDSNDSATNANTHGRPDALLQKMIDLAALQKDIDAFSDGINTVIGERGMTLSGGQKQRLAIARAVIAAPQILMLDDSLSAVDAETEKQILRMLEKERGGKSTVIISHRVSAFAKADMVAVFDDGMLVEHGSPRDLLARGGYYAKTAELQRLGLGD